MRLKLGLSLVCFLAPLSAQVDRIPSSVDETRAVALAGYRTPRISASADLGPVDPDLPMSEIALQFKPSAAQQQALDAFLLDLQNPASPNFHRWLKPEEFAGRFGLSQGDYDRAASWLRSHGFQLAPSARGRSWILFRGTAAQVRAAFGAEVHRYRIKGEMHYSVSGDPRVPEALSGVVGSITGLDDFLPVPESHVLTPQQTSASGVHTLAPDDVAAIYNFNPLLQAGLDGTGQTVVIVGQSRLNQSDIDSFRSRYNLPAAKLTLELVPGVADPGITSSLTEGNLDVQWAGAAARNANLHYVYAGGAFTALQYAVDQDLGQVITASYSYGCEANAQGVMAGFRLTAQQANAQGITWVNSSGDAGAAACDANSYPVAQNGFAIRTPASVPEVTAVGGTEFNEGAGKYWNSTNSPTLSSAIGYIPEMVWNDSASRQQLSAGGGGVSIFFPRPSWQIGPGVPNGNYRLTPDISFSAAGHDPFNVISNGAVLSVFGTSASTPLFAGMLAVLNQYLGASGLGNVNPALYALAQSAPAAFHDVATGDNKVPCAAGSPDCQNGSFGYAATAGYDTATGLGSVDLAALADAWKGLAKPTHALIAVSLSSNTLYQHAPDSNGLSWGGVKITLQEEAGVAATLTSFTINGAPSSVSLFSGTAIAANASISASIGFRNIPAPIVDTLAFSGTDANGNPWSVSVPLQFEGFAPTPVISGVADAASGNPTAAPGMLISIYGSNLAFGAQPAGATPLIAFMQNTEVTIGGTLCPLYYVSPTQLNVQVPYERSAGVSKLVVFSGAAAGVSTNITIADSAPAIFTNSGALTPFSSGKVGDTLVMFITGEGKVTPALADGATPAPTTPLSRLPAPVLPISMTIGGVNAQIAFAGIASGLVGVTQVNFVIPAGVPAGVQPVVVKVGAATSAPANLTILGSASSQ